MPRPVENMKPAIFVPKACLAVPPAAEAGCSEIRVGTGVGIEPVLTASGLALASIRKRSSGICRRKIRKTGF